MRLLILSSKGEEAKIVILSLVRNSGTLGEDGTALRASSHASSARIGFLKVWA